MRLLSNTCIWAHIFLMWYIHIVISSVLNKQIYSLWHISYLSLQRNRVQAASRCHVLFSVVVFFFCFVYLIFLTNIWVVMFFLLFRFTWGSENSRNFYIIILWSGITSHYAFLHVGPIQSIQTNLYACAPANTTSY